MISWDTLYEAYIFVLLVPSLPPLLNVVYGNCGDKSLKATLEGREELNCANKCGAHCSDFLI